MARQIAISQLNASSLDILNVIRANASREYRENIPEISDVRDLPAVGDILYGYPALANEFLSALVNRIALVMIRSATYNNPYRFFKKGYLEYGETVEEVFVEIAKAREFSVEKAPAREFKRTIPDVRSAFHVQNWTVQYPVTIQRQALRKAFTGEGGLVDLVARIMDSITSGANYDEYLLFKYLIIKGITHGMMHPVKISADAKEAAKTFRATSNALTFMSTEYNLSGVHTYTDREDQYIFMDSAFDAEFDVDVLAGAFNMDKATYLGHRILIDSWDTFDSERFDNIDGNQLDPITSEELALMTNVKAVIVDKEWFQVYDNLTNMDETKVSSGLYWNYFYTQWKTLSTSPFSNAIVFSTDTTADPAALTFTIQSITKSDDATVITLDLTSTAAISGRAYEFTQTEDAVTRKIAVHKYGAFIFPAADSSTLTAELMLNNSVKYTGELDPTAEVGATVTLNKAVV